MAEKDDDGKSLSQRELAKRAGCSQTYVSHRVALLRLVPDLRQAVIRHWMKEQQLPDAESGSDDEATSALLLPVREAATVYARLRTDLQEALALCAKRAEQLAGARWAVVADAKHLDPSRLGETLAERVLPPQCIRVFEDLVTAEDWLRLPAEGG